MNTYLGTSTKSAPRRVCLQLAEEAFLAYFEGLTLVNHGRYGAERAMQFGAQLASEVSNLDHPPYIECEVDYALSDEECLANLAEQYPIARCIGWSPDGVTESSRATRRSGYWGLALNLNLSEDTLIKNVKHPSQSLLDKRKEVFITHKINSELYVKSHYEQTLIEGYELINQDWTSLEKDKANLLVLPRDCFHASPPMPSSRSLYGAFLDDFRALSPHIQNGRERLGKIASSDNANIASLFTVSSYGLFSRNYCDYFSVAKAISALSKEHPNKRFIFPIESAGFLHADLITLTDLLKRIPAERIALNIYDK
ncbi:hypothetical protein [Vibrio mediterranei]|uniref:hypothetical protein n=1 Tax=Vibrio mediterranei TaxID=689 RepID=UPI0040686DB3